MRSNDISPANEYTYEGASEPWLFHIDESKKERTVKAGHGRLNIYSHVSRCHRCRTHCHWSTCANAKDCLRESSAVFSGLKWVYARYTCVTLRSMYRGVKLQNVLLTCASRVKPFPYPTDNQKGRRRIDSVKNEIWIERSDQRCKNCDHNEGPSQGHLGFKPITPNQSAIFPEKRRLSYLAFLKSGADVLETNSVRASQGITRIGLWSPSKGVVRPAVYRVRTQTTRTGATTGRAHVIKSSSICR